MTTEKSDLQCPMCKEFEMQHKSIPSQTYTNPDNKTHIYVCDSCPFIGMEYYDNSNLAALTNYLNGHEK